MLSCSGEGIFYFLLWYKDFVIKSNYCALLKYCIILKNSICYNAVVVL